MLGADIAQRILSECEYQPAKPIAAQKRAAAALRHNEVRLRLRFDIGAQLLAYPSGQLLIIVGAVLVNIYLPALAAAVAARGGDASEIIVKIRFYIFHRIIKMNPCRTRQGSFSLPALHISDSDIEHRAAVDHQAAGVKPEHQQNHGRK